MKIKILKNALVKSIQTVQNVITSKSSLPILSNVLITADEQKVKMTGTDLDVGILTTFPSVVEEEGAIAVPAKRFNDIVRELPDEEVLISTMKNNSMTIQCSKCFFKILGLPKEDFPALPDFGEMSYVIIDQGVFKKMLSMTCFSMSHDETRYVLNGSLFLFKANQLTIVATDGKRLSLIRKDIISKETEDRSVIVPSKTIYELNRILQDEGEIKISFIENQIRFELGNITIISRLIEGEFPNYEQVIPSEIQEKILINRESFLLGVKRTALLATQDSQSIKMDILKNKIIISKSSPNIGEAKDEIETVYNGREITTGFNPNYFIDVLKVIPKDEIGIEILGPDKPAVIRIEDWYIYLSLPIQLA